MSGTDRLVATLRPVGDLWEVYVKETDGTTGETAEWHYEHLTLPEAATLMTTLADHTGETIVAAMEIVSYKP